LASSWLFGSVSTQCRVRGAATLHRPGCIGSSFGCRLAPHRGIFAVFGSNRAHAFRL